MSNIVKKRVFIDGAPTGPIGRGQFLRLGSVG